MSSFVNLSSDSDIIIFKPLPNTVEKIMCSCGACFLLRYRCNGDAPISICGEPGVCENQHVVEQLFRIPHRAMYLYVITNGLKTAGQSKSSRRHVLTVMSVTHPMPA